MSFLPERCGVEAKDRFSPFDAGFCATTFQHYRPIAAIERGGRRRSAASRKQTFTLAAFAIG